MRQSSAAGALKVGGACPECFPRPLTRVTCRLLSCETISPEDGRICVRAAVGPRRSVRYKRSAALMSCLFIRWLTSSVPKQYEPGRRSRPSLLARKGRRADAAQTVPLLPRTRVVRMYDEEKGSSEGDRVLSRLVYWLASWRPKA
ncbi:hypothetical protein MRX96_002791 [Rhipicephalus microplus]